MSNQYNRISIARRARLVARREELKRRREASAAIEACLAAFDRVEFTSEGMTQLSATEEVLRSMGR